MVGRMGWASGAVIVAMSAVLAGCSGDDDPITGPANVSGTVTYDDVPTVVDGTDAHLDYANTKRLPARAVVVEALDATSQAVLASTVTDATGHYSLPVPLQTQAVIRAKAQMKNTDGHGLAVEVVDNTNANALWATVGAAFSSGSGAPVTQDLNAPSGWTGTAYDDAQRAAGPFAILDTVYTAVQKVVSVDAAAVFTPLTIGWSPNNVAALDVNQDEQLALGQIGTSHFEPADPTKGTGPALYILGKADNDTDEYDSHVIAHEFGHYLQSVFSRDDTPGGTHRIGDLLDMRVAFSEGWGDGWSAIALNDPEYTDTDEVGQSKGFVFDVSAGAASNPGWFNEASVQKIFWDLNAEPSIGFAGIWSVMKSGLTTSPALTGMHSFGYALRQQLPGSLAAMATIFAGQSVALASDPYGSNEVNFGTAVRDVNPLYLTHPGAGATLSNVCGNNDLDPVVDNERVGNKLGDFRYLRVTLADGLHTFTATKTSATNPTATPVLSLYSSAGDLLDTPTTGVDTQTLTKAVPAGDYVLTVVDAKLADAPAAQTCFDVQVN